MTTDTARFNRYIADYADTVITFVAAAGVLFVAAAGLILSYESLLDLAVTSGAINRNLAWLWPLTLDTLAIVASLNVLWAETRQARDRYAWTLVIIFTVLSVVFNATHAGMDSLLAMSVYAPVVIAAFVGIVPPVAAALSLHLVVRLIRRVMTRATVITALRDAEAQLAALSGQISALNTDIAALARKREALKTEVADLRTEKRAIVAAKRSYIPGDMEALDEANATRRAIIQSRRATLQTLLQDETLTISDIAARLGVSERTVQRDINALNNRSDGHLNGATVGQKNSQVTGN